MKAYRYRLPLSKPLQLGSSSIHHREGLLIYRENEWAEAAPLPAFSRERLMDVIEELRRGMKECVPSLAFARDASSRPIVSCSVPVNALVQGKPDEILTRTRELAESGCQAVKLKVGRAADVRLDIELTVAVSKILRSDQNFRLDANRAWDLATATTFANRISACPIEYIEEPLRDPSQLEVLFQTTKLPYALDESLAENRSLELFPHAAALVVKPTMLGGRERIEQLAATGKPLVFSGCFESGVGIARIAQLANEFSPQIPAGLDTYSYLASDVLAERLRMQDWHVLVDGLSVKTELLEEIAL